MNRCLRRVRGTIESHPDWQVCGEAVDGREALAKAQGLKPDLVILDFAMPHLDGLRTAMEINKLMPETPIVMFTMYGSGVMQEAKKHGIARLVDKADSGALVTAIEELLAQKPDGPEHAQAPVPLATSVPYPTSEIAINPIRKLG